MPDIFGSVEQRQEFRATLTTGLELANLLECIFDTPPSKNGEGDCQILPPLELTRKEVRLDRAFTYDNRYHRTCKYVQIVKPCVA